MRIAREGEQLRKRSYERGNNSYSPSQQAFILTVPPFEKGGLCAVMGVILVPAVMLVPVLEAQHVFGFGRPQDVFCHLWPESPKETPAWRSWPLLYRCDYSPVPALIGLAAGGGCCDSVPLHVLVPER